MKILTQTRKKQKTKVISSQKKKILKKLKRLIIMPQKIWTLMIKNK